MLQIFTFICTSELYEVNPWTQTIALENAFQETTIGGLAGHCTQGGGTTPTDVQLKLLSHFIGMSECENLNFMCGETGICNQAADGTVEAQRMSGHGCTCHSVHIVRGLWAEVSDGPYTQHTRRGASMALVGVVTEQEVSQAKGLATRQMRPIITFEKDLFCEERNIFGVLISLLLLEHYRLMGEHLLVTQVHHGRVFLHGDGEGGQGASVC